jgi:hypothetical protein
MFPLAFQVRQSLRTSFKSAVDDVLAEAVRRLNELGYELKPYPGPMNDPFSYADYEKGASVRLWLTAHIIITNRLVRGQNELG